MRGDRRRTALYVLLAGATVFAQSASRDLPEAYRAGQAFNVTIVLAPPSGAVVAALEDRPPTGWTVSSITQNGSFDAQQGKVKWGPFFGGGIPPVVAYALRSPHSASAPGCFVGTASFDGQDEPVEGDACVVLAIPALSSGGVVLLAVLLGTIGAGLARRRSRTRRGVHRVAKTPIVP